MAVLGIALAAIVPSFFTYLDVNTANEARSGALSVAQEALEATRQLDPTTLPSSGETTATALSFDGREYEIRTIYCPTNEFCNADSRHIVIEVSYGGQALYLTESVFTKLR